MNVIGLMQGRLSPPDRGRLQSFPTRTWRAEFALAQHAGLSCIEWIYDQESESVNPLRTDDGLQEIRRVSEDSGVSVWSVCADYYMTRPLIEPDGTIHQPTQRHLSWLLGRLQMLGARHVVLPFVDASSLTTAAQGHAVVEMLRRVVPVAERTHVELHLEMDLQAQPLVELMTAVAHPMVKYTYDIGNCAALGHDPTEELTAIGAWVGSVHVKDRPRGGPSVGLGTGAADFPTVFRLLGERRFSGPLVLQAARDPSVSELQLAIRNRQLIEQQVNVVAVPAA